MNNSPQHIALALSGGQDSMVLLHMLHAADIAFHAYHVNHRLSPHADAWANTLQQHCEQSKIPYTCLVLNERPREGESIEAWARVARYTALINALPENSVLATAHHQRDQVETFLLQLLRGAGPKGLSGMAPIKKLCEKKNIVLHRPLLDVTKAEIEVYAKANQLTWIEDESNQQLRFDRNFIRHEVLPLLQSREPAAVDTIARAVSHVQEQQTLLSMFLEQSLPQYRGSRPGTLSIKALLLAPESLIKALLRHWLAENNVSMPSEKKLLSIISNVLQAGSQASPRVCFGEWVVTRYRDDLFVLTVDATTSLSGLTLQWDTREDCILPFGAGVLRATDLIDRGIDVTAGKTIQVRFRSEGETIFVPGVGHQSFKKWCQTRRIPPWQRSRLAIASVEGYNFVITF